MSVSAAALPKSKRIAAPSPKVTPPRRAALAPRRLRPATLHSEVLAKVRDMITTGELEPGVRLTERVLTEQLGVSRTPLREALKVLAHEGMVELLPNCGARVTRLRVDDARHLFEVIEALESHAGRLACERITEPELSELKALHHEMHACYLRRELPPYFRLNQAIHDRIVGAARNPMLQAAHAAHCARIRRARYKELQVSKERWRAAMREHELMIDALSRRDADALASVLKDHLHQMFESACHDLRDEARGDGEI